MSLRLQETQRGPDDAYRNGSGSGNSSHSNGHAKHLIYVDGRALTRDCIANELAMRLPEFRVVAVAGVDEIGTQPDFDGQECSILYNCYALHVGDPQFLHDLSVMQ